MQDNYSVGFIGCGNMGSAMARSAAKAVGGSRLVLANRGRAKAEALAAELGSAVGRNEDAAACSIVYLAVKPQMMEGVLTPLVPVFSEKKPLLITMAAGLSMEAISALSGGECPIIRIMPNTPASIGSGVISYCCNPKVTEELEAEFLRLTGPAGLTDKIPESLIDAAGCVSGCGPAWAYMFMEALADGGVACGLPRDKAIAYAAQTLLGSARMVLESGKHPGALKDAVCSPAGSTIQGVRVLEERAFRGAAADAVIAAFDKTKELGRKK